MSFRGGVLIILARYSDIAIKTAVMVRLVFHQPLRQTERLLSSLLDLMDVDLPVPDHTTISRRAAQLTPVLATALLAGPVTLVIDSTGLRVYEKRSKAETAMARYQRILGDHLHARTHPGQQAEAAIGVAVLNRMIDQARPNSVRAV